MANLLGGISNIYLIGLNVWREIRCLNSSVGTSSILDIVGPLEQIMSPSQPYSEWQLIQNDVRAYKFHRLVKLASLIAGSVVFPFLGVMMLIELYFEDLPDTWNVGSEYRPKNLEKKEVWIEVNGVCTDRVFQESNGRHIASIFRREIKLFWNPTQGLLFDLIECMMGRTFNGLTLIAKKLELMLAAELRRKDVEKVVLIAHSQGAIIASNAIAKLIHHNHEAIHKLEVYTFGSAADSFSETTSQGVKAPHYEHYANSGDFVARIGVLHWMFTNYKHQNRYRYPGQLFVSKRRGHLLSEHYLSPLMQRAYFPSPCQDATEKEDFKTSKLYSYMDEVGSVQNH